MILPPARMPNSGKSPQGEPGLPNLWVEADIRSSLVISHIAPLSVTGRLNADRLVQMSRHRLFPGIAQRPSAPNGGEAARKANRRLVGLLRRSDHAEVF